MSLDLSPRRDALHGRHPAVCWAVVDCGDQYFWNDGYVRRRRELRLCFELVHVADAKGQRRRLDRRYTFTRSIRGALTKEVALWQGLTKGEAVVTPLWGLLGEMAMLDVRTVEASTTGSLWTRIDGIYPFVGPVWPPHRPATYVMLTKEEFRPEAFHRLPETLRLRITESETWAKLCGHEPAPIPRADLASVLDDFIPW